MKKRHTTTLELYAKTIRMRAAEKRALRERLVAYMEYHPARVSLREATAPSIESPLATLSHEPFLVFRFSSWQFRTAASFLTMLFIVGVPYIAERAVPGDVLYPMKVRINEEVKGSFAWTPAEKIAWQAERMERRIAEARLLAKEGNLTSETEAAIALTVREHAEDASREIAALRTTDAEGAAVAQVALESALDVQTAILATEGASTTASSTIDSLAAVVSDVKQGVAAAGVDTGEPLTYERMTALIETETTRARELATSLAESVDDSTARDIERRLSDIERTIGDARTLHETGKQERALDMQRVILSDLQKIMSYMTDIDVRSSVSLETLVPKKLTTEEQMAMVDSELEALKNEAVRLRDTETTMDEGLLAKFRAGTADLDAMVSSIEAFRTDSKYAEALALAVDARALIADLDILKLQTPAESESATTVEPATTTPDTASTTDATTTE